MNRSFTEEDIELANMHMKKCLASAAIRKMQIRTTKNSTNQNWENNLKKKEKKALTISRAGENLEQPERPVLLAGV